MGVPARLCTLHIVGVEYNGMHVKKKGPPGESGGALLAGEEKAWVDVTLRSGCLRDGGVVLVKSEFYGGGVARVQQREVSSG